jgi:YHS domain-containing protein
VVIDGVFDAAGELRFDNKTYWICSLARVERFASHPLSYVGSA